MGYNTTGGRTDRRTAFQPAKGKEPGRQKKPDRHNMDSWHEKLFTARKIACNIFATQLERGI